MKYNKKKREKDKVETLAELPKFLNQIILLLNGGLNFRDAFIRVGSSYRVLSKEEENYFTKNVESLVSRAQNNGANPIRYFSEFAKISGIKELARVANLIVENQSKGMDLRTFLEVESRSLWVSRKQRLTEEIRIRESKMSFPLGILLLVLIIVVSAPAMMQM